MTKEMLQSYQSKKNEITELDWVLHNRWKDETLLCTDVILDYRTGYPRPQSVPGFDYPRYDRMQERDSERKAILEQETEEIEEWVEAIPDSITRRIFRMTFLQGRKQKDVAKAVNLDRSRVSRKIDDYLKNAHKAQNAHV